MQHRDRPFLTVTIDPQVRRDVRIYADLSGLAQSTIVERALRSYLANEVDEITRGQIVELRTLLLSHH